MWSKIEAMVWARAELEWLQLKEDILNSAEEVRGEQMLKGDPATPEQIAELKKLLNRFLEEK